MNESLYSISEIGAYLDNGSIYTPYYGVSTLSPQIKSPTGIILMDTLKWTKIQGVFLSQGNESYLTIGNFKTDANTTMSVMPAPPWPNNTQRNVADYYVDDVSVIDVSTPAYAGPDQYFIPGDSVYIGRPREVGLDDDCFWYALAGMTPLDTAAGIWVKPANTTTYVVKQDICGNIQYDTVVVYKSGVGLNENKINISEITINPNPAKDYINIEFSRANSSTYEIIIHNSLGENVGQYTTNVTKTGFTLSTAQLPEGVYSIILLDVQTTGLILKKFIIAK